MCGESPTKNACEGLVPTAKSPLRNPFLVVDTSVALLAQIGATQFGSIQDLLRVESLDFSTWLKMVALACTVLVVNELDKRLRRAPRG